MRLIEENNKTFELSNINYLKNESKTLLDRVSKEKISEEDARRLIDKLVNDYRNQAEGDNRFELLTNCLTILEPAVYRYGRVDLGPSPNDRIRRLRKRLIR